MSALEQVALQPDAPQVIVRVMLTFDRAADDFLGDCVRRETVSQWLGPQIDIAYDPDRGVMPTTLRLALPAGESHAE